MDAHDFERMIASFAREYYSTPRSTEVPTPQGPKNLVDIKGTGAMRIWVLEDFADWLKDGDDRTQRERMKA